MTRDIPDVHLWIDDTPCFPLYRYRKAGGTSQQSLLQEPDESSRVSNVTDDALGLFQPLDETIAAEDVFFFIYGVLHSPQYRATFAEDLRKALPRIPSVGTAIDFWSFSEAGRALAHLHTEYEQVEGWPDLDIQVTGQMQQEPDDLYRVARMRYARVPDPIRRRGKVEDRTTIIYNDHVAIGGIPERAHDYRLGSRSAIDWVIESHRVRTDKQSGIINDPNDWGLERGNPRYIFDLVRSVVTVSMRTLDIVDQLPDLKL